MRGLEVSSRLRFFGADNVHDCVDQSQMGERLWEVPEVPTGSGVDLFRVELEWAGVAEKAFAQMLGAGEFADLDERRYQPEGTDRERSFFTFEAVVGGVDHVAQDEAVDGQFVGDRQHGGSNPRIVGR